MDENLLHKNRVCGKRTWVTWQLADFSWRRAEHSAMKTPLLLKHQRISSAVCWVPARVTLSSCLQTLCRLMWSVSKCVSNERTDFQCNSEPKTKCRETLGRADMTGRFLRELLPIIPRAVRGVQEGNVPFQKHKSVWEKLATLIKAGAFPGLVMPISKLYSRFQPWPPSEQTRLSCVSRNAARCLIRREIKYKIIFKDCFLWFRAGF